MSARRAALSRAAEIAALALIAIVMWRILFTERPAFNVIAAAAGATGIAAALLKRDRVRTPIDLPLAAYLIITLLSAVINHRRFLPAMVPDEPAISWQAVLDLVVLTVYFFGASWVLANKRRLGALVTVLVVAISLFGVQAAYDHARIGFQYRLLDFHSLMRWTGYTPLGLLFAVGFALTLPVVAISRSWFVVCTAAILTAAFFLDSVGVYSRAATISALVVYVAVAVIEMVKIRSMRLAAAAAVGSVLLVPVALRAYPLQSLVEFVRGDFYSYHKDPTIAYTSRFDIWRRVLPLVREHPLLGVGPGNYSAAMRQRYANIMATEPYYTNYTVHAHNMALQIAAESGIPALIAFLLVWWRALTGLISACRRDFLGILALAFLGALVAFFLKGMLEHLLTGLDVSARLSFLLWTLFAAAAATMRLRARGSGAEQTSTT